MLKKNILLLLFIVGMTILPAFSIEVALDKVKLKEKSYNVISEALLDDKIHENMKVDIFAVLASLVSNEKDITDDRSIIEKFYQDIIINNDKSSFSVDIMASKRDDKDNDSNIPLDKDLQVVEILKDVLKSDNINMKMYALDIISKTRLTEILDVLVEMLNNPDKNDEELESSLISTIGLIGNDSNVELLEKYLSGDNLKIRLNAIQSIGDINSEKGNTIIKKYLKDDSLEVALLAAGFLANNGDEDAINLLKDGIESPVKLTNQKTLIAMSHITNPDILPLLRIASKSNDEVVKAYVLEILAMIDSPESVKIAKTMIDNKKLMPRALIAISQNSSDEAFNVYSRSIQSNNEAEKTYTVAILTQVKDKRVIPVLKKALDDKNQNVRLGVAKILYTLGDKSGIPVLKEALKSENADVNLAAAAFLGFIGDDYGKGVLLNALHNYSLPTWQKLDITIILDKLGNKSLSGELATLLRYQKPRTLPKELYPSKETLQKLLKNDSKWTQLNAAVMLTKLNDFQCLPVVEKIAQDPDLALRATAIKLLGRIKDERSLPILAESLNDEAVRVRVNSAEAIIKILSAENKSNKSN